MPLLSASALVVAAITAYPAYGDRGLVKPPSIERRAVVETVIDRGPILEIVVRCKAGTAVLSYSKVERRYCSPKHACDLSLATTIARSCN